MTPRLTLRLEKLLRLASDPCAAENERLVAAGEALRLVTVARGGYQPVSEWTAFVTMRRLECELCDEPIRPATRALRCPENLRHRHEECHAES